MAIYDRSDDFTAVFWMTFGQTWAACISMFDPKVFLSHALIYVCSESFIGASSHLIALVGVAREHNMQPFKKSDDRNRPRVTALRYLNHQAY